MRLTDEVQQRLLDGLVKNPGRLAMGLKTLFWTAVFVSAIVLWMGIRMA